MSALDEEERGRRIVIVTMTAIGSGALAVLIVLYRVARTKMETRLPRIYMPMTRRQVAGGGAMHETLIGAWRRARRTKQAFTPPLEKNDKPVVRKVGGRTQECFARGVLNALAAFECVVASRHPQILRVKGSSAREYFDKLLSACRGLDAQLADTYCLVHAKALAGDVIDRAAYERGIDALQRMATFFRTQ